MHHQQFSIQQLYAVPKMYRIYSRNFLTKILYLNLGCVIYAKKRF